MRHLFPPLREFQTSAGFPLSTLRSSCGQSYHYTLPMLTLSLSSKINERLRIHVCSIWSASFILSMLCIVILNSYCLVSSNMKHCIQGVKHCHPFCLLNGGYFWRGLASETRPAGQSRHEAAVRYRCLCLTLKKRCGKRRDADATVNNHESLNIGWQRCIADGNVCSRFG